MKLFIQIFTSLILIASSQTICNNLNLYQSIEDNNNYITKVQKGFDVLHYLLNIELIPKEKLIYAKAEITLLPLTDTLKSVELNFFDNLDIREVILNNTEARYEMENNRLIILNDNFISDTTLINITYSGKPKGNGMNGLTFGEVNNSSIIYSLNEPDFAPAWFPCDDDPNDKATIEINITNDSSFVSVSNGKLTGIKNENDKRSYSWKSEYPVSTYLIAIYSAPYQSYAEYYHSSEKKDSMEIIYYVMPEHFKKSKTDFAETKTMIKIFSELFGEYPFYNDKYGIAEFLWNSGAMENQTITGIGYNMITGKNFFRDTFSHELAHHWWGNSVGVKSWNDIWLNEGFSTYSEALYLEKRFGYSAYKSSLISKSFGIFRDKLFAPSDLFGYGVYNKGAWVLHMLRTEIGDSTFFSLLKRYYDKYKYSNASTNDFKEIAEELSGKDLNKFFDQWVFEGTGKLEIDYSFIYENTNPKVCLLKIDQVQKGFDCYDFLLTVKIKFKDGSYVNRSFNVTKVREELRLDFEKDIESIDLDPDNDLLAVFNNNSASAE